MNAQELEKQILKTISKNIISRRKELRLSKNKLAKLMGIYRQGIYQLEKSKGMTIATLSKLSIALDISISDLLKE